MRLTQEKIQALSIFMHRLLSLHFEPKEEITNCTKEFHISDEKISKIINKELLEQKLQFEDSNCTYDNIDIQSGNITHHRLMFYYMTAIKEVEKYSKQDSSFSGGLLVVLILSYLVDEKQLKSYDSNKDKNSNILSTLIDLFIQGGVKAKSIKKMTILCETIINSVQKANYAKMMKKHVKKRK